jgi:hypothetical protein
MLPCISDLLCLRLKLCMYREGDLWNWILGNMRILWADNKIWTVLSQASCCTVCISSHSQHNPVRQVFACFRKEATVALKSYMACSGYIVAKLAEQGCLSEWLPLSCTFCLTTLPLDFGDSQPSLHTLSDLTFQHWLSCHLSWYSLL